METIQGTFSPLNVNNGKYTKFVSDTGIFQVKIHTITPEDGSGVNYLINYSAEDNTSGGYVNLRTMKGYLVD